MSLPKLFWAGVQAREVVYRVYPVFCCMVVFSRAGTAAAAAAAVDNIVGIVAAAVQGIAVVAFGTAVAENIGAVAAEIDIDAAGIDIAAVCSVAAAAVCQRKGRQDWGWKDQIRGRRV
jgi:hypothetical protein